MQLHRQRLDCTPFKHSGFHRRMCLTSTSEAGKETSIAQVYHSVQRLHRITANQRKGPPWLASSPDIVRKSQTVEAPILSRCIHDIRSILESFEQLRVVADYRTPLAIRIFIKLSIVVGAFAFGPYFAFLGLEYSEWAVLDGAVALAVILSMLKTVQRKLENPFIAAGFKADSINLSCFQCLDTLDCGASVPTVMVI
eukprot:NODE_3071_length_821_cov_99.129534_g2555_i0.p1 GENE.NODE_3071_length_821_cov_99.129534_g2555_i0~~NODE_3071_length_821_cov_99.129534_g2555_i0.p1  ORF type:complete len:197 (-),score=20.21 NODE_3071_length_821_cov_99.129534_g2555_i0:72-662(-)